MNPRSIVAAGLIVLYAVSAQAQFDSAEVSGVAVDSTGAILPGVDVMLTHAGTGPERRAVTNESGILPNTYDDSGYYGISTLDRPHVFVSQSRYRFPTLDGTPALLQGIFGNWDISAIFQAQSGAPFDVRSTTDTAGVGPGSGSQFWNVIGDPNGVRTEFDCTRAIWFDKSAFQNPALGTFGIQDPNSLRQPGFWDLNMSLRKSVQLVNNQRIELRWEAFNVLNHPRLGNAVTNPNSGDFGTITSKAGNRTMQLGLQYVF